MDWVRSGRMALYEYSITIMIEMNGEVALADFQNCVGRTKET